MFCLRRLCLISVNHRKTRNLWSGHTRPASRLYSTAEAAEELESGINLNFQAFYPETETGNEPVIILHGLFGSSKNWVPIAKQLVRDTNRRIYIPDARNHGDSPHVDVMDYTSMSQDILLLMKNQGIAKPAIIGHSLGGRTGMTLALTRPLSVERLVVIDVAPRDMQAKSYFVNYVQALKNVDFSHAANISEARSSAADSMKSIITSELVRAFLVTNVVEPRPGQFVWKCNLEAISKNVKHITKFTSYNRSYHSDALFVGGSISPQIGYVCLGKEDYPEIHRLFPRAEIQYVDGAGHWVHYDKPQELLHLLTEFLNKPSSL